jgi:hypothetical protein
VLTDISRNVRPLVVDRLAQKLGEVEAILGRCVVFYEDDQLRVARGRAVPRGEVHLSSAAVQDLSVIGEEIMHLHRWTAGFPAIEPQNAVLRLDESLKQLGGHFDEAAFFPFLEQLGLNPRAPIDAVMAANARTIQGLIPDLARNDPRQAIELLVLRKRLAITYAQAALLASPTGERDALLALFDDAALAATRDLGRNICAEIDAAIPEQPAAVEQRLNRCLLALGVGQQAARVRVLAYPMN